MLWLFRSRWSRSTVLTNWLARNAYAAFIIHPIVVVSCGVLASGWAISPAIKFIVIGCVATAGSFITGHLFRQLPGLNRVV